MFAGIKTGGKQYKVAVDDVITIEKLPAGAGEAVAFDVLMLGGDGAAEVGAPLVAGASVRAEVVAETRGPKVISFKKRRRQNSKRKRGHRQDLTVVRITDILANGDQPPVRAAEATGDSGVTIGSAPAATSDASLVTAAEFGTGSAAPADVAEDPRAAGA